MAAWFAFRVRANHERAITLRAQVRRIEAYLPERVETRRWSDRVHQTKQPLFPGYLFARCSPEQLAHLCTLAGVVYALPSSVKPDAISEADILTVRQLEASGYPLEPTAHEVGEAVTIRRGPLKGIRGILRRANTRRLIVNIESFSGRAVSVEVAPEDLF